MSQSSNQNQSNSTPSQWPVLYDVFLDDLGEIDEAPSTFEEKFQSLLHHIKPSPDSMEYSIRDGESSRGDSDASFNKDEIQEFLNKIYKPVKRDKVYGFDYDEMTLKMLLLNEETPDSFKLLGVVGMPGVGKTTLCRMILDEKQVKQFYFPRLLIAMPAGPMEKVVETMLDHLGVDEETINSITKDHKLPGLLYALHLHLKGKKFLIVLDDVKDEDNNYYKELICCLRDGHGFPKGHGGAVILNGRNEKAIKEIVDERSLHRLELLSEPENCWEIYQTLALGEAGEHEHPRVKTGSMEVYEELKKKCGGLPLAARIMGELKHREKIRRAFENSQQFNSSGEEGLKEKRKIKLKKIENLSDERRMKRGNLRENIEKGEGINKG